MSRVTEAEIAKAIENYLEEKTNGQASIQELVRAIPDRIALSAEDLAQSTTRSNEALWEQQVRNVTSHKASLRTASNERWKRLHQFLSEVGVKALRTQLGQTLGIAQVSDTAEQYEANIRRVFGGQADLFNK